MVRFCDNAIKSVRPRLVALYSSVAQSGKSTVASILNEAGWWSVKFAGPLKDMVRGLLGSMGIDKNTVERMVEGDLKEEVVPGFATVTTRRLMQTLGTDWGREAVEANLWARVGLEKAKRLQGLDGNVVIDDLRFPNEYTLLKEAGATTVRIIRPDAPTPPSGSSRYEGLLDTHEFDVVIDNNGTLDDLRAQVCAKIEGV